MTNDIFDFKRFGRYFAYDCRNAWHSFGLTMIILGCMPVIMYVMYGAFHMVISGTWTDSSSYIACRLTALAISFVTLVLSMPSKLYGSLTDKREGADWLMLPASRLEKYISMLLILLIVSPAVYLALFCGTDALMSLINSGHASSVFNLMPSELDEALQMLNDHLSIHFSKAGELYKNWYQFIMIFTLGAVCFKRAKVSKTVLCLILAGMALSFVMTVFVINTGNNIEINISEGDVTVAAQRMVYFGMAIEVIIDIALAAALWFRLKTLKH